MVRQVRKHLLQQLSVSLWMNNARIILRYWTLQCEDSDFPFPKPLLLLIVFVVYLLMLYRTSAEGGVLQPAQRL